MYWCGFVHASRRTTMRSVIGLRPSDFWLSWRRRCFRMRVDDFILSVRCTAVFAFLLFPVSPCTSISARARRCALDLLLLSDRLSAIYLHLTQTGMGEKPDVPVRLCLVSDRTSGHPDTCWCLLMRSVHCHIEDIVTCSRACGFRKKTPVNAAALVCVVHMNVVHEECHGRRRCRKGSTRNGSTSPYRTLVGARIGAPLLDGLYSLPAWGLYEASTATEFLFWPRVIWGGWGQWFRWGSIGLDGFLVPSNHCFSAATDSHCFHNAQFTSLCHYHIRKCRPNSCLKLFLLNISPRLWPNTLTTT